MADRICDNCMGRIQAGSETCPKCGIQFENTNPGGALPSGWLLAEQYTIGRYIEIDGEGVTYSAIDGTTLQRVIIKEFMPVTLCAARDETGAIKAKPGCEVLFKTTRMDFSDLYNILMRLGKIEGLVQVMDVLEENNTAYAVIEKVEGPSLDEYLKKRQEPIEASRALALMRPVLAGVEALHGANIVHRGISPENIVLESGGTARLCGFATLALRQQGSELKPKLYPGYTAPEQYTASEFEGRYTDIYALGAVLYRLVTGMVPQPAGERRAEDVLRPARTLNKTVPPFLSAGIMRAMRMLPAERIQSVAELHMAFTGQGGRTAKGPLGLTKQQLIVGAAAIATIVVLLLVILIVSIFTPSGNATSSSSASMITSSSTQQQIVPDFTGKRLEDVTENSFYTDTYTFLEPIETYSPDVEAGRIMLQTPPAGSVWDGSSAIQLTVSLGIEPIDLPDFTTTHTLIAQAEEQLQELEIEYTVVEQTNNGELEVGTVVRVELVPANDGVTLEEGKIRPGIDTLIIYVAADVSTIPMPGLVGRTQAEAVAELDRLGIEYSIETVTNAAGLNRVGTVESTSPNSGEAVATGATVVKVRIYGTFYMPNLEAYKNRHYTELEAYLNSLGIAYTLVQDGPNTDPALNGYVHAIDYVVNGQVASTTVVTIHYNADADTIPESTGP